MDGFVHLKVTVEDEGRRWTVELDHGKANEMGSGPLTEFERLVGHLEAEPRAMSLTTFSRRLTSRGTRIFVAGADVAERVGWPVEKVKAHVRWQRAVLSRLRRAPVFHVAVVDGVALGWGTEYLLTADWRIAGDGAQFGLPETGLGIVPGAGGTSELWAEIGVAHAIKMGMTGERLSADEALRIGLVHERAADVDAGLARARALADQVVLRSPTAVAAFKRGVLASMGNPEQRAAAEAAAYEVCVDHGDAAIGRNHFAEITAGGRAPWPTR
jgi:enoyl-CoA hydratase/carnithine racemase